MGPELLLARPDVLIFAGVCLVIFIALGLAHRSARNTWLETVFRLVEENSGIVNVTRLSVGQADSLSPKGNIIQWTELFEELEEQTRRDYKRPMSDIYAFTIKERNCHLEFFYNPEIHNLHRNEVHWRGQRMRITDWDHIKKIKNIGDEAHIMWKMGADH